MYEVLILKWEKCQDSASFVCGKTCYCLEKCRKHTNSQPHQLTNLHAYKFTK